MSATTRINADRQAIEDAIAALPASADPTYLYKQLEQLPTNASGGTATDANATLIGNTLATKLDAIVANTASTRYEYIQFEDVISANNSVTFYQRIDKVAGTVTALTLNLTPYTIAGTVKLATPSQGKTAIATVFEAITNGTNWTIGQPLRRVESWILGSTNTLVASSWINDDTGVVLSTAPVIGTDVRIEEDLTLDTLRTINSAIGASNDPIATSDAGNFSAIGFLKRLTSKLPGLGSKTTANSTSITIASDDIAIGNLGTSTTQPAGGVGLLGAVGGAYQQAKDLLALLNTTTAGGFIKPATGVKFKIEFDRTTPGVTDAVQIASNAILPTVTTVSSATLSGVVSSANIPSSAITTTATSAAFDAGNGTAVQFEVTVTALTGVTPGLIAIVQESTDGINYRTLYRFPTITVVGSYRSPVLPNNGRFYRYSQEILGSLVSITRSITRYNSNANAIAATGIRRFGGFSTGGTSISDLVIPGRVRRLSVFNRTAGILFLQFYDKAGGLIATDVPRNGESYPVAANTTLSFTVADFGELGTHFGDNARIGLSTTFATYTAASIAANSASVFIEVV